MSNHYPPTFLQSCLMGALLLALPALAQAQLLFTTNNGAITITGYSGSPTTIVIPSTTNGYPVTSIGDYAFFGYTNLTSVTIPDSVTSMGNDAFSDCTSLTSVAIPDSVTNIGSYAFYYCTNLTSVTIGNSVTSIGDYAFASCTSLMSVTIPSSVTNIGIGAFYYCIRLTSVIIPNSVTSIGNHAFSDCTSLTSVTIPNSVSSIGSGAFFDCTSLTSLSVDAANPVYRSLDGVLFNQAQTTLITFPAGRGGSYVIPKSVTSIGDDAFSSCTSLTSVTIPNSVTKIGDLAFQNCTSLTSLSVDAANPAYSSLDGVLFNPARTTLITFPAGRGGSYVIPNSVTSIGDGAFEFCWRLTSVTIPNSVTSIGDYAFPYCASLTSVTIPNSVSSIGDYAFYGASLTSVTIPNSVTSIGDYVFFGCTSLTSVTIGNSVTNIGIRAFYYCINLNAVYFQGNAPASTNDSSVFDGDFSATVYYLAGTIGWGSTFDGRPAVLWNPQAQTTGASFGVRTNRFGFNITASSSVPIVVEASTNLANKTWTPLFTGTVTNGSIYFSDSNWTNYPGRFYRIRSP